MRLPTPRSSATVAASLVALLVATSTLATSGSDALSTSTSQPAQLSVVAGTLGPPLDVTAVAVQAEPASGQSGLDPATVTPNPAPPTVDPTGVTGATTAAPTGGPTGADAHAGHHPGGLASTSVLVSWTGPAAGSQRPAGYFVTRTDGSSTSAACGSSSGDLIGAGTPATRVTCSDVVTGLGTYTYTVTAVAGAWTSIASSAGVTVASSDGLQFSVTADSSNPTAGAPFDLAVTALDSSGGTDVAYTGPKCIALSGPDRAPAPGGGRPVYPPRAGCASGSAVTFTDGAATVPVTLVDPQTTTVSLADERSGRRGTSPPLVVVAAPAADPTTNLGTTTTTEPPVPAIAPPPVTTEPPPPAKTAPGVPPPVATTVPNG